MESSNETTQELIVFRKELERKRKRVLFISGMSDLDRSVRSACVRFVDELNHLMFLLPRDDEESCYAAGDAVVPESGWETNSSSGQLSFEIYLPVHLIKEDVDE